MFGLPFPRTFRQLASPRRLLLPFILFIIFFLLVKHRQRSGIPTTYPWDDWEEEQASDSKVQVFIPIDQRKAHDDPAFCRDLWSTIASGYTVTLYNWELDKPRALETHKPKIDALANILSDPDLLSQLNISSKDLIFMVDGIDVIIQLSPSVLKERYHQVNGDVIAAGSFNCWPNKPDSPACKNVDNSILPIDLFWEEGLFALMKESMSRLPIHVNSGLVIGSLEGMATVFHKLSETAHSHTYMWEYDQAAFNIALSERDISADNSYTLFWCAEHIYDSLSIRPPDHPSLIIPPPHHPNLVPQSLPNHPIVVDKRTGVVPIALHFNGLEPKVGYNAIWEEMFHYPLSPKSKEVKWIRNRMVNIVLQQGVQRVTVDELCAQQLGLR